MTIYASVVFEPILFELKSPPFALEPKLRSNVRYHGRFTVSGIVIIVIQEHWQLFSFVYVLNVVRGIKLKTL